MSAYDETWERLHELKAASTLRANFQTGDGHADTTRT